MNNELPKDTKTSTFAILRETLRNIAPYLTLGVQLALAVIVFFAIGWWFDNTIGTDPWGKLIGVVVGVTGGMIKFFRTVREMVKKNG
ncbi:MAG: AtpZ/AtpI family protein [Bacteroidetes bacterium]|nr:AtpZ/AtpI family protein [Bacteroidota bacterium]